MALKWMSNIQRVINHFVEIVVTTNGQTIIELDKAYVPDLNNLLVTLNGIEQAPNKVYTEKTSMSLEFIPNWLRAGDEVRVYYIPNTISLGDIIVVGTHTDLIYMSDREYNSLALSVADKKFYINKGSEGWKEFILPFTTQNVGMLFSYEKQAIIDPTNHLIELQNISYSTGSNSILVFVDDRLVDPSLYTELTGNSFVFTNDLPIDTSRTEHEIEVVSGYTDSWEDSNNHNIQYSYNLDESINTETVTAGLTVVKTTTFQYDSGGNIIQETIVKGGKTIIKNYSYDIKDNIINIEVTVS